MDRLVRVGDATRALRVHRSSLVRWEREGRVTPLRGPGRVRFYRVEDIERLRQWRQPRPDNGQGSGQG